MKLPFAWLREWVNVSWEAHELASRLTMAGFEVEGIEEEGGDAVLEINVTPNRGDAMSVLGLAREVAVLSQKILSGPTIEPQPAMHEDTFPVRLKAAAACPKFVGRVIRGINNQASSPAWLQERLQRCGVRAINPVVDVTNYVLLELGQPMHAYDLGTLNGEIQVRQARAQESLTLLDGRCIEMQEDVLVIADTQGAVGLAGIMGGERTAVSTHTQDVFFEVAYFAPEAIAGRARRYGLHTDASQRFERGVDPALQERAMQRATALLLKIAGGSAGPVTVTRTPDFAPRRAVVSLRAAQLERLLGVRLEGAWSADRIGAVLKALDMQVTSVQEGWQVTPPTHRFDIRIEADLIEELARIIGYDAIPETDAILPQRFRALPEERAQEDRVCEALAARGYQEAITLAFVDPVLQEKLFPGTATLTLANPIASDLSVMRVSLWPGLLRVALENQRRQQERIRLFEHGTKFANFVENDGSVATAETGKNANAVKTTREVDVVAGLAFGLRLPEQWDAPREHIDFFDVKTDVQALLAATGAKVQDLAHDTARNSCTFEAATLPCLHPGRAARIVRNGGVVGWIGELHPSLVRELEFTSAPVLFELEVDGALKVQMPAVSEVSRFPQVRRDIAVVVAEEVTFSTLRERVTSAAPRSLKSIRLFDVYRGPGIEKGHKSVALGLIFQDVSRTLTDQEADQGVASIVQELCTSLNAKIRE